MTVTHLDNIEMSEEFAQVHNSFLLVMWHLPPELWFLIFECALSNMYCTDLAQVTAFSGVCLS